MLDKLTLIFILPFYGMWKYLIKKEYNVNKVQEKVYKNISSSLNTCFISSLIVSDMQNTNKLGFTSIFFYSWLSVIFLATMMQIHNPKLFLKTMKMIFEQETKKGSAYFYRITILKSLLYVFVLSLFSFSNFISVGIAILQQVVTLFLFVGFEFPDDENKRNKEEKVNKNWLEEIIPPTPLGSN